VSNPFENQFNSECQQCGDEVEEGELMFAIDGQFVCDVCAESGDNVCACGNFKKSEYPTCYECYKR